jgi:hypothetical protein
MTAQAKRERRFFTPGQEVRLPFGSFGTQRAQIEGVSPDGEWVWVRKYRARAKRWNKTSARWRAAVLLEEIAEVERRRRKP